jgi:hypothetical protein
MFTKSLVKPISLEQLTEGLTVIKEKITDQQVTMKFGSIIAFPVNQAILYYYQKEKAEIEKQIASHPEFKGISQKTFSNTK